MLIGLRFARGGGRRRGRHELSVREMCGEPPAALGERLWMRVYARDVAEMRSDRHEAVRDVEQQLARNEDASAGVDKRVDGGSDGPFSRVLDRHHAVRGI